MPVVHSKEPIQIFTSCNRDKPPSLIQTRLWVFGCYFSCWGKVIGWGILDSGKGVKDCEKRCVKKSRYQWVASGEIENRHENSKFLLSGFGNSSIDKQILSYQKSSHWDLQPSNSLLQSQDHTSHPYKYPLQMSLRIQTDPIIFTWL